MDPRSGLPQGATIALRGVGSGELEEGFEPAVPIIVDGVQLGGHAGAMHVLFDFDQVEIVRGAQGVAQGPSSLGGAILVRRTRPKGELDTRFEASAGTNDRRTFKAVVHAPRFMGVATKLAARWTRGGGDDLRNVFANRPENDENRLFVSASALFRPLDSIEVQYTYDADNDRGDIPGLLNISAADATDGDRLCVELDRCAAGETSLLTPESGTYGRTLQNFDNSAEFDAETHTLRAQWETNRYVLESTTGVRSTNSLVHQDIDGTSIDFYSTTRDNSYDQFSQDLRLTANISDRDQLIIGAYYLDTDSETRLLEHFVTEQLAQANLVSLATPGTAGDLTTMSSFDRSKLAVYAQARRHLDERWTVDGGIRWHDVDVTTRLTQNDLQIVSPLGTLRRTVPTMLTGNMQYDNLLGSLGVRYRVDDSAIIFLRGTQGHRSGGFDASARTTSAYVPFANEASTNVELGLKSDWWDNRLRLNLSTYRTWIQDQSAHVRDTVDTDIQRLRRNLIEVESRGVELEAVYAPNSQLRIDLNLAHGKAHHSQNDAPDLAMPGTFLDQRDRRPAWAPTDSAALTARYSWPYAGGKASAFARYRYHSDYQNNPALALSKVFNTTTLDVAVAWQWRNWTFQLFSNNVLDKRYPVNVDRVLSSAFTSQPMPTLPLADNVSIPAPAGLLTNMQYNLPKHTGLTISWRPTAR